ncbi:unnamed protein product [Brugia timori]|uniref:PHD-type domain-containing protein n=1 Tax=Brugia timori TaxID=42155 RepID=A0A3P7V7N5_9BILA|nr:unnamed protein product [Brugia timori]
MYIPEVRFGDVHSMDPVILSDVPLERFQQQCYLCMERGEEKRAYLGACMPCNKPGCKKCFHVTCAQAEGLLCEEGGGSKNVKYCGYCAAHAKKARLFAGGNKEEEVSEGKKSFEGTCIESNCHLSLVGFGSI